MSILGGRWTAAVLAVVLAAGSGAANTGEKGSGAQPESSDLAEALAELEAAGSPLTEEETARLLESGWDLGNGNLRWRRGISGSCSGPGTFSGDLSWRGLELRARRGRDGCAAAPWYGAMCLSASRWSIRAGDIGLSHGHGLLAGKPGRRSSGTADQSLAPGRSGLRAWAHESSGGALRGAGGSVVAGGVGLEFLTGRSYPADGAGAPETRMVRLSTAGDGSSPRGAVLFVRDPEGGGGSVSLGWSDPRVTASLEWVARAMGGGARGVSGRVGLRVNSRCRVEGAAGWVRGGEPSHLAVRPPWLDGWEGGGWSLRVTTTLQPGSSLKALVSAAGSDLDAGAGRRSRVLWDALWTHRAAAGWRWQLRWRRQGRRESSRSSRWPWLPPRQGSMETVTTVAGVVRRNYSRGRMHLGLRTRQVAGSENDGSRFLLTVGVDYSPRTEWSLRCQWDLAWGDAVDLVSALSPLQGYVVPRHWSRWQEQRMLGVGREIGSWRIQAGTASRVPAPSSVEQEICWEVWGDGALRW